MRVDVEFYTTGRNLCNGRNLVELVAVKCTTPVSKSVNEPLFSLLRVFIYNPFASATSLFLINSSVPIFINNLYDVHRKDYFIFI